MKAISLIVLFAILLNVQLGDANKHRPSRSMSDALTITQHFEERTLSPGIDVSMQCTTTSNYPSSIIWKQDGSIITPNTNIRYTLGQLMISSGVVGQLNISRIRVEDGGLFTCEAVGNNNITVSHSARLNVFGPPYIRPLGPIKVMAGGDIEIGCPYYGYPISDIQWEVNGKMLENQQNRFTRDTQLGKNGNYTNRTDVTQYVMRFKRKVEMRKDGFLSIRNVKSEYSGKIFTCIVKSPSGEMARRGFEIEVIEPPVLDNIAFASSLQEGQIAQVVCTVRSGDTPIFFSWFKDGSPIPVALKVEERNSDLFSVLLIRKVSLEHCGTYTCVASNHAAKVNKTAELYIKVAPKWLDEPKNTSFLQGSISHIDCTASGYPQPQVHWLKKNQLSGTWQPVLDIVGRGILSLPNGSLVIDSVSPEDEGFYSCRVENGVGTPLSKTIWMHVNIPVTLDQVPSNVTSRMGHTVGVSCSAYGDRPIHITWNHNGSPISKMSQRYKIIESNTERDITSTVAIQYSDLSDSGTYQCKATNLHGVAVHNVYVHIQEPPSPPTDIVIDSIKSRNVRISWNAPFQNDYIFSVQYAIQKHVYAKTWERSHTRNVTSKYSDVRPFVELYDLQPATLYSLRISAGSAVERSAFSSPISFTTLEEEPSLPPNHIAVEQSLNPGELKVMWIAPPKESWNGEIQGYYVTVVPKIDNITDSHIKTVKILSRYNQNVQIETVISNLLKSTIYAVRVKAYNTVGQGPSSMPVYKETKEGAPETPPQFLECHAISSTSLRVQWKEIPFMEQGGALLGYTVLYSSEGGPWINLTTLHTELSLHGLAKFTNHSIKVSGYSNYGTGPFSQPVICASAQDVPGPPSDIKVLTTTSSSLLVSWKKPFYPNGIITHYNIHFKAMTSSSHPMSYRVPAPMNDSSLWQEVRSLSQDTRYEVWVIASTSAGDGEPSKKVYAIPSPRVVAGIYSLGGTVSAGVGGSLLLPCQAIGAPQPRTVWYHNQNIITHHPRYTLNEDNSLLIDKIDQSLSGNYTCLAKNLFGSDSVSYAVKVVPLPDPPSVTTFSTSNGITLEWTQPSQYNPLDHSKVVVTDYHLIWKQLNPVWSDDWTTYSKNTINELTLTSNALREPNNIYVINDLKCGTTYVISMTSLSRNGNSQPKTIEVSTLGGEPIAPRTTDWFWSNSSHVLIQLSGWDENGCEIQSWLVDYRQFYTKLWLRAENKLVNLDLPIGWVRTSGHSIGMDSKPNTFVIGNLAAAHWYQFRVKATNDGGTVTSHYSFATKTITGDEISPPYDYYDMSITVIVCSAALLLVCAIACIVSVVRKNRHVVLCSDSTYKSETVNVMSVNASRDNLDVRERQDNNSRVYSSPINVKKPFKGVAGEGFEISPYAQFRMDFRTFGNMDNQGRPSFDREKNNRCSAETSFQEVSESEDSDSISKTMTMKQVSSNKRDKMR